MDKDTDSESVKRFQERLRYSVRPNRWAYRMLVKGEKETALEDEKLFLDAAITKQPKNPSGIHQPIAPGNGIMAKKPILDLNSGPCSTYV